MSAYFVVQFTIRDADKFEIYAVKSRETIKEFGGEVIARGAAELMHGESEFELGAILRFSDRDTALRWYQSEGYQALVPGRDRSADTRFLLYESFSG